MGQPYEMHRTLMRAFPDRDAGGADRVLWRLDVERRAGTALLYVQSFDEPNWTRVTDAFPDYCLDPPDADVQDNPTWKRLDEEQLPIDEGKALSFRLRANPSVKKKVPGRKNSRRMGLIHEEDQLRWLRDQGEKRGFRVLSAAVVREDRPDALAKGKKRIDGNEVKLSVLSVRFDGVLQVQNRVKFLDALRNGIGPAKAFGFGLLSLAPA